MDDVAGEVCWVRIDNWLYVASFYRTPSDRSLYQLEQLDKSSDNIAELTRNNHGAMIVVAGDFNAASIDWEAGIVPPGAKEHSICQKVLDICSPHGLEQQQRLPTREGHVLDLFCTNKPRLTMSVDGLPGLSDHDIVCADCNIRARAIKKPPRKIHLWSKADGSSSRTLWWNTGIVLCNSVCLGQSKLTTMTSSHL